MSESSTRQIDAVWIVHSALSDRCHLKDYYYAFEAFVGLEIRGMTTVIITKCDSVMSDGDYFQYPLKEPFKVPECYNDELDLDTLNELFWMIMMQPGHPFEFAKDKNLHSKPICWTNVPKNCSRRLNIPVDYIELT